MQESHRLEAMRKRLTVCLPSSVSKHIQYSMAAEMWKTVPRGEHFKKWLVSDNACFFHISLVHRRLLDSTNIPRESPQLWKSSPSDTVNFRCQSSYQEQIFTFILDTVAFQNPQLSLAHPAWQHCPHCIYMRRPKKVSILISTLEFILCFIPTVLEPSVTLLLTNFINR